MLETGTSRLLVCRGEGTTPEGVVTEMDVVRRVARR
jgi:CBS domain-containing protein